jgi:hypothetical protein
VAHPGGQLGPQETPCVNAGVLCDGNRAPGGKVFRRSDGEQNALDCSEALALRVCVRPTRCVSVSQVGLQWLHNMHSR